MAIESFLYARMNKGLFSERDFFPSGNGLLGFESFPHIFSFLFDLIDDKHRQRTAALLLHWQCLYSLFQVAPVALFSCTAFGPSATKTTLFKQPWLAARERTDWQLTTASCPSRWTGATVPVFKSAMLRTRASRCSRS